MNLQRRRVPVQKSRLENEVILAVVILYVLLSAAMLGIHHLQPDDVETQTSSTSPSHGEPAAERVAAAIPLTLAEVPQVLADDGYTEIRDLRAAGVGFRAAASKEGRIWQLEVDSTTRRIQRLPPPAR